MKRRSRPPLMFIRKLCADLPEEQINEAEERFWRYLEIVRQVVEDHSERFDKPENRV
jgi:hypothetical protein